SRHQRQRDGDLRDARLVQGVLYQLPHQTPLAVLLRLLAEADPVHVKPLPAHDISPLFRHDPLGGRKSVLPCHRGAMAGVLSAPSSGITEPGVGMEVEVETGRFWKARLTGATS